MVFIHPIYVLYIADILQTVQIGKCQIWKKIMKIASNQVHMDRFGLIIEQNRSHGLWEAGCLLDPPNQQKKQILGFGGLGVQGVSPPPIPPIFFM